jgi:hypothetical protein
LRFFKKKINTNINISKIISKKFQVFYTYILFKYGSY